MPPACPVESHDGCYGKSSEDVSLDATGLSGGVSRRLLRKRSEDVSLDATGLARGGSRWLLRKKARRRLLGCHGLGPWRFTMATNHVALSAEGKERETPPDKPVAS